MRHVEQGRANTARTAGEIQREQLVRVSGGSIEIEGIDVGWFDYGEPWIPPPPPPPPPAK
jgi:hypothetical protein